ncbi:phospholipase A [Simiduia curdlanivorans]|uniref:Phospholipase A1 n=1 Tax=Simiduia curdlanivorans TaxID=1492769 RepID=A0ABV8V5M8_9GAMM|nr:phospholipase A [Simiduia curdlanivorans]MDN3638162.1 phospholipase A [Simiduia curdlanivorans]
MMYKLAPLVLAQVLSLGFCSVALADSSTELTEAEANTTSAISSYKASKEYQDCLISKMQTAGAELPVGELRASCEKIEQLQNAQAEIEAASGERSVVAQRLIAEEKALDNPFEISSYRRNYVLFASYNDTPNTEIWKLDHPEQDINKVEVKFQLSFKALVARGVLGGDLWGAYTQQSWWQLYAEESAPFRETNYEPELMLRWDTDLAALGFNMRVWSFGYNHESNGRSGDFSRSWNRLMAHAVVDRGNLIIVPRVWWRFPEDEATDDNPDIDDYLGYGDVAIAYKWGSNLFSTTIKGNFRRESPRMGVQLEWTFPVADRFKGYIQYYDGYGESLIDYNHRSKRIGFGVLLNDFI